MVIIWLLNSMEPAISKPYLVVPFAWDVKEVVRETYSDVENASKIFELTNKLRKARQGERNYYLL